LISTTDILPTEQRECPATKLIPAIAASTSFSDRILPYVKRALSRGTVDDIEATLRRATIIQDGHLVGVHTRLPRRRKVLLLGSGLVAKPAVDVFTARSDIELVIGEMQQTRLTKASNNLAEARALGPAILLDVTDRVALGQAVAAADVVVR
jgi:alpha-aminoadipic semialdehyde synthase